MMIWPIAVLIIAVTAAVGIVVYVRETALSNTPILCRDPNNISSHVYNPARLQTINDCMTVSGVVDSVRAENDGDYHLWSHVDAPYANLPNSGNDAIYQGDLVAEIICATTVTQQDAVLACENYANQIPIPSQSQNI